MTLSTFNFRKHREGRSLSPLLLFAFSFGVISLGGEMLIREISWFSYTYQSAPADQIPEGNWYTDNALGVDSLSHTILYYNIGESIENARSADLLLLGNSRLMFAFPFPLMDAFAAMHNIRYFSMGFGHTEKQPFVWDIMNRHELRPQVVIVNADNFFVQVVGKKARSVMADSWWRYLKGKSEGQGLYFYHLYLHKIFPHYLPRIPIPTYRWKSALLRSSIHGSWFIWNRRDRRIPVKPHPRNRNLLTDEEIRIARKWRDLIRDRGGCLILTHIPAATLQGSRARAEKLAQVLEVPFLSPELEDLTLREGSHLSEESAQRFATAFLHLLEGESAACSIGIRSR